MQTAKPIVNGMTGTWWGCVALGPLAVVACGASGAHASRPGAEPRAGEDARDDVQLQSGTPVCFGDVLPMRYVLEDALRARDVAPVDSCTTAEIRIEERGDSGKYVLRYQRIGDDDWRECESTSQDRATFLEVCTEQLVAEMATVANDRSR
jgi:hypothetical protein